MAMTHEMALLLGSLNVLCFQTQRSYMPVTHGTTIAVGWQ